MRGGGGKGALLFPSLEYKNPMVRKRQLIEEFAMTDGREEAQRKYTKKYGHRKINSKNSVAENNKKKREREYSGNEKKYMLKTGK